MSPGPCFSAYREGCRRGGMVGFLVLLIAICSPPAPACPAGPPIRMAYLQNDLHHLPLWVAMDKGFFREENIAVEIAGVFRAGPEIMTAFAAGELDAAYVGEAPATIAAARGVARVTVLAQANIEGSALVVSSAPSSRKKRDQVFAKPGYGTVQDLLLHKAVDAGLVKAGANTLVLPPPEMLIALKTGQIDGFVAWEPYPSRAEALGIGRVLARSGAIWPGHPCCVLVIDEALRRGRPGDCLALRRAHGKAIAFIRGDPEAAVSIAVRHTGMDSGAVREALLHVTYADTPDAAGLMEYFTFLERLGYVRIADPKAFIEVFLGVPGGREGGRTGNGGGK